MTNKQFYKQLLIERYSTWKDFEKRAMNRTEKALANDNMRTIEKIFLKNYKEDIKIYLTNN